jgi:hypothetical protein
MSGTTLILKEMDSYLHEKRRFPKILFIEDVGLSASRLSKMADTEKKLFNAVICKAYEEKSLVVCVSNYDWGSANPDAYKGIDYFQRDLYVRKNYRKLSLEEQETWRTLWGEFLLWEPMERLLSRAIEMIGNNPIILVDGPNLRKPGVMDLAQKNIEEESIMKTFSTEKLPVRREEIKEPKPIDDWSYKGLNNETGKISFAELLSRRNP